MNAIDAKINAVAACAEITAGFPLRVAADSLPTGDTYFVQMRNIDSDTGIKWGETACVSLPTKREPYWLQEGDVLFAARGAKNYAVIVDHPPGKAVCSPHFFVLRLHDASPVTPEFLAWQINQKPAQDHFLRNATGSHIPNIRKQVLAELQLAVPCHEEQERIVSLSKAAAKERHIMNRLIEIRIQELEAIASGLFKRGEA